MVGYLLEELRDGKNYEQFQKDIADANIFIGSLIFIEELAEKVHAPPLWCLCCRPSGCKPPLRALLASLFVDSLCGLTDSVAVIVQIVATVTPRRDYLDACLVFPSMPAVM